MYVDIRTGDKIVDVALAVDISGAYAAGDVVCDTAEIANAVTSYAGRAVLQSLTLADKADQKAAMTLVFLKSNTSLGTKNSAGNISDANAASEVIGHVAVAAADYLDLGGASVACVKNIGLLLHPTDGTSSLYVSAITSGSPTYGATTDLTLKLGFLRTEGY